MVEPAAGWYGRDGGSAGSRDGEDGGAEVQWDPRMKAGTCQPDFLYIFYLSP